jgi:AraC-like DNA-binding protein
VTIVEIGAPAHRKEALWNCAIESLFGSTDMRLSNPERFRGRIDVSDIGPLGAVRVRCDHEDGARTRRHIQANKKEYFVLSAVRAGRVRFTQRGRECVLDPGMIVLFDLNEPYSITHDRPTDLVSVRFPGELLALHLRRPHDVTCTSHRLEGTMGVVLKDLMNGLTTAPRVMPPRTQHNYSRLLLDALAGFFDGETHGADETIPDTMTAVQHATFQRCVRVIETWLTHPALCPGFVARQAGISLRYVHQLFRASGVSVADHIQTARLARCHATLRDPSARHRSIKQIAFEAGFGENSHFSTAFRRHFGVTPSTMRSRALTGERASAPLWFDVGELSSESEP